MKRSCQNVTNVTKGQWRSIAIQTISEPKNNLGAGFILRAGAGIRVQDSAGFVWEARFCLNHDEPINYTVRVMYWCIFNGQG